MKSGDWWYCRLEPVILSLSRAPAAIPNGLAFENQDQRRRRRAVRSPEIDQFQPMNWQTQEYLRHAIATHPIDFQEDILRRLLRFQSHGGFAEFCRRGSLAFLQYNRGSAGPRAVTDTTNGSKGSLASKISKRDCKFDFHGVGSGIEAGWAIAGDAHPARE